jgi:protein-disulfide isomerase
MGLAALGMVTGLVAVFLKFSSPTTVTPAQAETQAAPQATAVPDTQAQADAEAQARAEWDAQQRRIDAVLQSMDRATLIGSAPTKGSPNAEVVLIKFSDFQCSYCAVAASEMKTFMNGHESDVLYVYKHFPLNSIHPEATPSAKAAWAAGQQGQFWLYHDGLFAYQERLGEGLYGELAEKIGLDLEQFNRDRNSPEAAAAVARDLQLAQDLQLRGTPTFLMNNIMIPGGAPLELFEELVVRLKSQS